jgi:hypothetical protein
MCSNSGLMFNLDSVIPSWSRDQFRFPSFPNEVWERGDDKEKIVSILTVRHCKDLYRYL